MSKGSDNCCHRIGDALIVLCLAIPFVAAGLVAAGPWVFPNDPFINRYYKDTIWGYGAAVDVGIVGVCLVVYSCCGSSRMRWVRAAAAILVLVGAGGAFAVSVLAYQQEPRSPNSQADKRDSAEKEALNVVRHCEPLSDVILSHPAILHEMYVCEKPVHQKVVDAAVEAAVSLGGQLPTESDDQKAHNSAEFLKNDHPRASELLPTAKKLQDCVMRMSGKEGYKQVIDKDMRLACLLVPATMSLGPATAAPSRKLPVKLFSGLVAACGATSIVCLIFACCFGSASRREYKPSRAVATPPATPAAVTPSVIVMDNKGDPVAPSAPVVEGVPYPAL